MQDFLGREYGPGDLVIYGAMSGRSVNMVIGRVVEVYDSFRSPETYKWLRLEPGQLAPFKRKGGWFDALGNLIPDDVWRGAERQSRDTWTWRQYASEEREETVTKVKVEPLRGARWTQHHGHDYYVDTRTGKRIDPYRGVKHQLVPGHEIDTRTGEPIPDQTGLPWNMRVPYEHRKYVSTVFQPWVEQRHDGPKPVTLEITENIVKWEGELPE